MNEVTYDIHDNYKVPFKVVVRSGRVEILDAETNERIRLIENPKTVFVGESPATAKTLFSGGYGPDFRGNTVLIETELHQYLYVGSSIYTFTTEQGIIMYVSEVGNNDVPYPYGLDGSGRYYLMEERVILLSLPSSQSLDPYGYLYSVGDDTSPFGIASEILGVSYLVGSDPEEHFRLTYQRNPRRHYHYPWMSNLQAMTDTGELNPVSEDEYVAMMEELGQVFGIVTMSTCEVDTI